MKNNIFPFQVTSKPSDRHCLNGHRSALVWFTGLSFDVERSMFDVERSSLIVGPDSPPITLRLNVDRSAL